MEPYSADKIKRKKRKYSDTNEDIITNNIVIPFNVVLRKGNDIYQGSEKIPFRKRNYAFQTILRNEFE